MNNSKSKTGLFAEFFQDKALDYLKQCIGLALAEDGRDLTSEGLFAPAESLVAEIVAKEETIVAGLPVIDLILSEYNGQGNGFQVDHFVEEGSLVSKGQKICRIKGTAWCLLGTERIVLNFLAHLSGIANQAATFVIEMQGTRTRLLDTRKTLPGLRYPEKYAVLLGGGKNHRLDLSQMLMLKDNHIDRAGSISKGVNLLRQKYSPCPPIEVECRNLDDVQEAVSCNVDRIMLDNMTPEMISACLEAVPDEIETEISGGVNINNIKRLAALGADYISVGCLTNSAQAADLSMRIS